MSNVLPPRSFQVPLSYSASFSFSITLSSKYLRQSSTVATGLSSGPTFQIGWQKSGELIFFWRSGSDLVSSYSGLSAKEITSLDKQPDRGHPPVVNWVSCTRPRCLCPHLISHGFIISLKWPHYWLCGWGLQPCPERRARRHCLAFFTDVEESISSFADSVGRG